MKLILAFLLVGLCALVQSGTIGDGTTQQHKTADKDLLEKQRKILTLFYHINQPSHDPEHLAIVETFKLEEKKDQYTVPEAVHKIIEHYTNNYNLPKGEIFSISYHDHLDQAIALFDLLYYAKDFETFYQTAVVARHWINEGIFLYACSVAIIHRPDCYGILLPPIYEMYPWYFFDIKTIQEAYRLKQTWNGKEMDTTTSKYPGYTIVSNYSGHYMNLHPEQSLSYYLEDVGLNSFYYTYYLYYPFWMDGKKYGISKDRRGEMYYIINQQLFARYYMERLSNGMGQVHTVDFHAPMETPYYPSLQYPNGLLFSERPKFAKLSDYFYHYGQKIQSRFAHSRTYFDDLYRRVADAIDRGYAFDKLGERVELYNDKHGIEVVSNLLQSNPDSPDDYYYGPWLGYGRHLVGYSYTPLNKFKVAPSVLEHLETSLRDPGFYQLYNHLMTFYARYQSRLKPYTKKDLTFPGVVIEKVEMDRLITYFDEFYSDLTNAVYFSEEEIKRNETQKFKVRAKQYRLNHKPFTYKINVKSDKDVKGVMKIFIGPTYDEYGRYINMSDNRRNFFEIDKFTCDLKTGENTIKRSSYDATFYGPDRMTYHDLYKKVMGALEGKEEFKVDPTQNYFTFPLRYMLPKGTTGGFPFTFYFIIYPYKPYSGNKPEEWTYLYPQPGVGGPYIDDAPIHYPFDRPIKYGKMFVEDIPNTYFYKTKVYHKKDINAITAED